MILSRRGEPVSHTIVDPGMDGLDTYKKILEIHPEQKAIIASGFSETDSVKEDQSLGARTYIRKPFLLEKIGSQLRKNWRNRQLLTSFSMLQHCM